MVGAIPETTSGPTVQHVVGDKDKNAQRKLETVMDDPRQRLEKMRQYIDCFLTNLILGKQLDNNKERRVHGFAVGDRVAVVDGEYKGAYGKLTYVGGGWCNKASEGDKGCRERCWIFCVGILGWAPGITTDEEKWLPAKYLTHVD